MELPRQYQSVFNELWEGWKSQEELQTEDQWPFGLWMTLIPWQRCHLITILFIVLKMRKSVQTVSFSMRKTTFKHPLSIDPRELGCSNTVSMVFRPTSRMEFFRQFQVSFPMSVTYMKMRMSDGSEALRKQR